MVVFPNAKINIGLQISGKRSDGYHNIETIFYPIHLWDSLEIIENRESNIEFSFTSSGTTLKIADETNLCVRAYNLLKYRFPQIRSLHMHLLKGIPAGAGLGGGSSDAASALSLLNTFFSLNLSSMNQQVEIRR